jgi:hypothetical protein
MRFGSAIALICGLWVCAECVAAADLPAPVPAPAPISIDPNGHEIGGLSGIELSDDGARFTALSDRSFLIDGVILRDATGRMTGARVLNRRAIALPNGQVARQGALDAEGIADGPAGQRVLSFEGQADFLLYTPDDTPEGKITPIPQPPQRHKLHHNALYEAVAIDAEGAIYTLPERSGHLARPFPIWRYDDGAWTQIRTLPRRDLYMPVGADFAPDGLFFLLERRFDIGFAIRIRQIDLNDPKDPGQIVYATESFPASNFEGLSAWQDSNGATRLTLVSDNNFLAFLPSSLMEIMLAKTKPNQ